MATTMKKITPDRSIALETGSESHRVALRGVRVRSRVSGLCHRTTVEQTFVNLEPAAIEAVYSFPLPEQAAVCGFEVITGDRVLTGRIEESEKAIEQYDEAISRGDAAYMLERDRPDVFTLRVGNIKPKQAATVKITYVAPADRADTSIRIAYPTTVAPRYAAQAGADPIDAMVDADALNPPHVLSVPYGLSLEVDVQLPQKVAAIRSPSHEISVWPDEDAGTHRVMLAGGQTAMDRDIVLEIELKREAEPAVQVARGRDPRESYLAVTFVPEFDVSDLPAPPPPSETVFVLDCSGSMQGTSIAQAIAALQLCLRALSPGDTFNICRFGSTFEMMSSEPLVYSDATLRRALDYVYRPADLGGTELHAPLQAIFSTPVHVGKQRQIVLLTDGQVTNEPALIELARRFRATNRIFTFGIGSASSSYLVRGLARATGGAAEFIAEGERIDEKVLRQFGRIASPMLSDVIIDWGGAEVQTLAEIPPVFDGDVLTIFGRALGRLPGSVTLRCLAPTGPQSWTVAVPRHAIEDEGVIATMWARRMIQSLEEVNDIRRTASAGAKESRERQMLMDLSKEFGLLCSLTTYIAVEHRTPEERNAGQPELRRVPVMLAAGWGGGELLRGVAAPAGAMMMAALAPAAGRLRSFARERRGKSGRAFGAASLADSAIMSSFAPPASGGMDRREADHAPAPAPAPEPSAPSVARSDLQVILSLQSADGWFESEPGFDELARKLVPEWNRWRERIGDRVRQTALPDAARGERALMTVSVLLLLRIAFAGEAPMWRRAERKARAWLSGAMTLDPRAMETWLAETAQLVQRGG